MVAGTDSATGLLASSKRHHRILSESLIAGLVMLLDLLIIAGTGVAVYILYLFPVYGTDELQRYATVSLVAAFLMIQSFYIGRLYKFSTIISPGRGIGRIISISSIVFLSLVAVGFALKISVEYSRVWLFTTALASVVLLGAGRTAVVLIMRIMARRGLLARNILIYGANEQAQRFLTQVSQMTSAPWNRVIGVFDDRRRPDVEMEVKGDLQDLIASAREHRADDVIVALPWGNQERVSEILRQLKVLPTNIRLSPDLASMQILSGTINYQYGVPLASVYEKPMSAWHNIQKRVFDIVVSGSMLLVLSPLMLALFAGVKLDSPGPIFFRQRRYGFNNELINIWKLRTMFAEQQDENAERLATPDDPRVTRFGSFLRRTSLDELPQLFNVFSGDMSLVGPRPHALRAKAAGQLYQDAVGEYAARHRVKPGLTGWAQVNGWRGETDTHEKIVKRVEHDLYYIENWSIGLDIKILIRTVGVFYKQENAY